MSAPHHPTEGREHKPSQVACAIIAGDLSALPASDYPCYSDSDWQDAAQSALDGGDFSELGGMIAHERALQSFREWQGGARNDKDAERREFTGFDEWVGTSDISKTWGEPDYFAPVRVMGRVGL